MRVWFKIFKDARIIQDETIENTDSDTRTHKIFKALEEACTIFDLGHPVWLEKNIAEFKNGSLYQKRQKRDRRNPSKCISAFSSFEGGREV